MLKLNIGSGDHDIDGYVSIDRKHGSEAYPLEGYEPESVDEIRASHILEHFDHATVPNVLLDWYAKLKPGGVMKLAVPDFEFIARAYCQDPTDRRLLFGYAYGGQGDPNDYHYAGFDRQSLRELMRQIGLRNIKPWESENGDCAGLQVSLNLEGEKPVEKPHLPYMAAVMSMPRLSFTENVFCAMQVVARKGIPITKYTGAWWHHGLERIIEEQIAQGAEWILTIDYDTVFDDATFEELCYLFATHKEADSLAAWQSKRDCNEPLLWMTDDNGNVRREIGISEFEPEITKIDHAHMGLTLYRAEAFNKMPHPWFFEVPNAEGKWNDGRKDPDISFWEHWKAHGNSLYMANHVCIGHMQQVITWPDQNLKPFHQYITDYQKLGKPEAARR